MQTCTLNCRVIESKSTIFFFLFFFVQKFLVIYSYFFLLLFHYTIIYAICTIDDNVFNARFFHANIVHIICLFIKKLHTKYKCLRNCTITFHSNRQLCSRAIQIYTYILYFIPYMRLVEPHTHTKYV